MHMIPENRLHMAKRTPNHDYKRDNLLCTLTSSSTPLQLSRPANPLGPHSSMCRLVKHTAGSRETESEKSEKVYGWDLGRNRKNSHV